MATNMLLQFQSEGKFIKSVYESSFISGDLDFINIEHLHDNYPLFMRGTEQKFILVPHHHISFSYD